MLLDVAIAATWAACGLLALVGGIRTLTRWRLSALRESIRRLEVETGVGTSPDLRPILADFLTSDWRERQARRWSYGDR